MIRPIQFPSIDSSLENSVIKVFNTTDIGLISENDSIKILHKSQGINLQYKLDPFNIDINILEEKTQFKYSEDLYLFNYSSSSTKINSNISLKNWALIKPSLFFQLDNIGNISHGFSLDFNKSNINIITKYQLINNSYYLDLIYDDFEFEQKIINVKKEIDLLFSYNSDVFYLDIQAKQYTNDINRLISGLENQELKFNENIRTESYINLVFKIKENHYFKTHYSNNNIDFSLDIFNNLIDIIKINKYKFDSDYIAFDYSINKKQNTYNFGIFKKHIDSIASLRLRTSLISNSLEVALGAPIINSYDTGSIISKGIFFNFQRILKQNLKIQYNTIYLKEYYDIRINNYLLSIIGIPIGSDIKTLDYNYKDALILGLDINYIFNKAILDLSLNQHIPINIKKNDGSSDNNSNKTKLYGGGFINLSLSIPIK